jgi:hypothetical protein
MDLLDATITDAESWYEIGTEIRRLRAQYPQYRKDFDKTIGAIDHLIKEYSQLTVRFRRNPSPALRTKCDEKIQQSNVVLNMLQQHLVLLMLDSRY